MYSLFVLLFDSLALFEDYGFHIGREWSYITEYNPKYAKRWKHIIEPLINNIESHRFEEKGFQHCLNLSHAIFLNASRIDITNLHAKPKNLRLKHAMRFLPLSLSSTSTMPAAIKPHVVPFTMNPFLVMP